jgi:hypothetical protein
LPAINYKRLAGNRLPGESPGGKQEQPVPKIFLPSFCLHKTFITAVQWQRLGMLGERKTGNPKIPAPPLNMLLQDKRRPFEGA